MTNFDQWRKQFDALWLQIQKQNLLTHEEQYKTNVNESEFFLAWKNFNIHPLEIIEIIKRNIPKLKDRDSKLAIEIDLVDESEYPLCTYKVNSYEDFHWHAGKPEDEEYELIESIFVVAPFRYGARKVK